MDSHDRVTVDADVLVGKPVIKGTRIAVEFVIDLLARGYTPQQIVTQYDHLDPAFGPTAATIYWSATSGGTTPLGAWYVDFLDGRVDFGGKSSTIYVRAVRTGS